LYNRVEFLSAEGTTGEWLLEVRLLGVVVGRIRRHPWSEMYRYYRVPDSHCEPLYEEKDLEMLLKQVSRKP